MAEPRRPIEIETPFGLNKQAKRRFGFITTVLLVGIVGIFFLKKNQKTEDPTRNLQARAQAQNDQKGGETQAGKLADNQGVDVLQANANADADFIQAMKRARDKEDAQKKAQDQAKSASGQPTGGNGQGGDGGNPSVSPANGTVPGAKGGGAVPMVPGEPANKIQYDSAHWMKTPDGTFVRPGYQTGSHYPVDGGAGHQALEQLYLKSFAATTTVGTTNGQFLAALRERFNTVGPMGPRRGYGRAAVPMIQQPTKTQPDGWGGWVQIDPLVSSPGGK